MISTRCVYCLGKGTALPSDPYLQEKFWARCTSQLQKTKLRDMMRCPACEGIGWILATEDF